MNTTIFNFLKSEIREYYFEEKWDVFGMSICLGIFGFFLLPVISGILANIFNITIGAIEGLGLFLGIGFLGFMFFRYMNIMYHKIKFKNIFNKNSISVYNKFKNFLIKKGYNLNYFEKILKLANNYEVVYDQDKFDKYEEDKEKYKNNKNKQKEKNNKNSENLKSLKDKNEKYKYIELYKNDKDYIEKNSVIIRKDLIKKNYSIINKDIKCSCYFCKLANDGQNPLKLNLYTGKFVLPKDEWKKIYRKMYSILPDIKKDKQKEIRQKEKMNELKQKLIQEEEKNILGKEMKDIEKNIFIQNSFNNELCNKENYDSKLNDEFMNDSNEVSNDVSNNLIAKRNKIIEKNILKKTIKQTYKVLDKVSMYGIEK